MQSVFKNPNLAICKPINMAKLKEETYEQRCKRKKIRETLIDLQQSFETIVSNRHQKYNELLQAQSAFQTKILQSAIKIQQAYRRYKTNKAFSKVLEKSKTITKERMKEVLRQIEEDTTYDPDYRKKS